MVLDERHRSSIYQKLVVLFGDDDADALMSVIPSFGGDEVVTKQFLRAELAELRTELGALENRMTMRLGGAIGIGVSVLAALELFA